MPLRTMRGVSTRVIWMSRAKRSWPTPTGKTGIDRAFRLASDSSSEASDVSAPSVTITRPASGRPDSSSRARSSASPSCVDVPSYCRSAATRARPADEEKRKKRRTKRFDSVFEQRGCRAGRAALHELAARLAVAIGDQSCCASRRSGRRGSSAAERRPSGSSVGRTRQNRSTATSASRKRDEHGLVARRAFAARWSGT